MPFADTVRTGSTIPPPNVFWKQETPSKAENGKSSTGHTFFFSFLKKKQWGDLGLSNSDRADSRTDDGQTDTSHRFPKLATSPKVEQGPADAFGCCVVSCLLLNFYVSDTFSINFNDQSVDPIGFPRDFSCLILTVTVFKSMSPDVLMKHVDETKFGNTAHPRYPRSCLFSICCAHTFLVKRFPAR